MAKDVSKTVIDLDTVKWEEIERHAKLAPSQRILNSLQKAEEIRSDLRNRLMDDFPELSSPEINMKVLRSLTPVRIGKNHTEPAYYGWLC